MSNKKRRYTKTTRHRLKAHDAGINRHNKGVAHEDKAKRLSSERAQTPTRRRIKKEKA